HELTHVVQQSRTSSLIQRAENDKEESRGTSNWRETVRTARAALAGHDTKTAEKLYREAIITAAASVSTPVGITEIKPKAEDIRLDFKLSNFAETRQKEIPTNETNYWHWIYFGSDSLMETQAHTESVINHELIHVRQYQKLWNIYKMNTSPTKGSWENFMKPFSLKARVEGPEELEAEITSLPFLKRLSSKEQEEALRGLFVAYINTSTYIPAKGEIPATTTTIALPQILDSY